MSSAPTSRTRRRTPIPSAPPLDGHRSRARSRTPQVHRRRSAAQMVPARRAHLPYALRRGLVDGHSVGRLSVGRPAEARRTDRRAPSTSRSRRCSTPSRCRAQRAVVLDWPYVEGLRLDEAMHPLAILAVGLYGKMLPNQNGAPLRLVVPWKYGFKGIKSIVKIRLTETAAADHLERLRPARVRLLRQRQSRGRSSALEPGDRAAHRRASAAARRCRSTATASRWRACTPAWTSAVFLSDGVRADERDVRRRRSRCRCEPAGAQHRSVVEARRSSSARWCRCWRWPCAACAATSAPIRSRKRSTSSACSRLIFLVAALACTPLKMVCGWTWPLRVRRMLGLLAFFYAALHVATYTGLDQDFDWTAI